jgi:hypothetical protein
MVDHPQHASQHELAQPQDLFEQSGYTYAKGELPLSDFVHPSEPEPLGDIARVTGKSTLRLRRLSSCLKNTWPRSKRNSTKQLGDARAIPLSA